MSWNKIVSGWMLLVVMAGLPASSSYQLGSYGFGNGGTANSSSTNYSINGTAGEVSGKATSTNYQAGVGEKYSKQANVPTVTLTNDDTWYNKLHIVIGPQNNPSDAKFAVAISTDNFTTVTKYVKSDFTVGSTLTTGDYLTYAGWGSSTGQIIRGLARNTVYTVKVKAIRGNFTESGYGPTSSAATQDPAITFDIDVAATDISTSPPYQLDFGSLGVSTVTDSPKRVWVTLDTNGESGGTVYVSAKNTGLSSAATGYTIGSVTGDLAALSEGMGAQVASATQASGGPFTASSPYNGSAQNVGVIDNVIREIFTASSPMSAGRGSFILKVKTKPLTPASSDYTETLTAIASITF